MKNPAQEAGDLVRGIRLIEAVRWRMPAIAPPRRQMVRRDWVVERFMDGVLDVAFDGHDWQTLQPGDAIVYAPGCRFSERPVEGKACFSVYFRFTGPDARLRSLLKM